MSEIKPLGQLVSSLLLDAAQEKEFERIAQVYDTFYQTLLTQWYAFSTNRTTTKLTLSDFTYLDQRARHLQKTLPPGSHDFELPLFACNELCRNLRENEFAGRPLPHPTVTPLKRDHQSVVFYWGFDIKVREHHMRVPLIGHAATGRFRYFTGSIVAVGVRRHARGMQCLVYFRDNEKAPVKAEATAA